MDSTDIGFKYSFDFQDGSHKRFLITLDPATILIKNVVAGKPDWTILGTNQCSCCKLDREVIGYCPVAVNIADLIASFKDILSHEPCTVSCTTSERTVSKKTIVQDGLSSIIGIIMATSGCPTMDVLRPMARFHLPFASVDESLFRSVSFYLLRQFFIEKETGKGDFQLKKTKQYWGQIEKVNEGILNRIKHATELDADRNAIVILNCLAQILNMEIDEELSSLKPLFFPSS